MTAQRLGSVVGLFIKLEVWHWKVWTVDCLLSGHGTGHPGSPCLYLVSFIPSNPISSYLLSSPPLPLIIISSSPIITAISKQRVGVITLLPINTTARNLMIKYHYKHPLSLKIQFFACGIETVGFFRLCGCLCGLPVRTKICEIGRFSAFSQVVDVEDNLTHA